MNSTLALPRPRGILDLPLEILHLIFSCFEYPHDFYPSTTDWIKPYYYAEVNPFVTDEKNRRECVQNARLVCRRFNELASPYLFAWLEIGLSQKSLDFVEHISRRPFLAKGVRHLSVLLNYFPGELTTSLSNFKAVQTRPFNQSSNLGYHRLDLSMGTKNVKFYDDVNNAWNEYFDATEYATISRNGFAYQQCLLRGFADYRDRHIEQLELVTHGTFVRCLATSLTQMPRCDSLLLGNDCWESTTSHTREIADSGIDWLKGYLTEPILVDLPVAMHKAGVELQRLHVACFPINYGYRMLQSGKESSMVCTSWVDLSAACGRLEEFSFTPCVWKNYKTVDLEDDLPDRVRIICAFLSAILSSSYLREIDFHGMDDDFSNDVRAFPRALARDEWSSLECLYLNRIRLTQRELDTICAALPPYLKKLSMVDVALKDDGIWAIALDILRNKFVARCVQQRCKVEFRVLEGGDFYSAASRIQQLCNVNFRGLTGGGFYSMYSESMRQLLWPEWNFTHYSIPESLAERYVSGNGVHENPLTGDIEKILRQGPQEVNSEATQLELFATNPWDWILSF
ncbi:hypothetical protein BJX64DRAFT_291500 [Aspergillus heterothallicus]